MSSRARRILLNSLSTYARMGISLLLGLALTRATLVASGSATISAQEAFGVLLLLVSVGGITSFVNDGLQQAFIRFLATESPQKSESYVKLFASGWVLSATVGTAAALILLLFSSQIASLFRIPAEMKASAPGMLEVIAISALLTSFLRPWQAALLAMDNFALENARQVSEKLLALSAVLVLPLFDTHSIIAITAIWQGAQPLTLAVTTLYCRRRYPGARVRLQMANHADIKRLASLAGWTSLLGLGSSLYERTDQVLINLMIGPAYNAYYALAAQLQSHATSMVTSLTNVLLPTTSRLLATGTRWEQHQLLIRSTRYVVVIALPIAGGIAAFATPLVHLWLGTGYQETIRIIPLLMLVMLCRTPQHVGWVYLTAARKLRWPALALWIDALANVGISIVLVKYYDLGLSGIVLGTLMTNALRFIAFQMPYVARTAEMPVRKYWRDGLRAPLVFATIAGGGWIAITRGASSQPIAISAFTLISLVYAMWVWTSLFDEFERTLVRQLTQLPGRRTYNEVSDGQ
jgi:O-antigen/teichoic acid export membrane protein